MPVDPVDDRADPLQDALALGAAVLDERGVRYALIGGLATGYRSRPRYTKDIDVIIDVPAVSLPGLLAFRLQDQADIEALVAANGPGLDLAWIESEWQAIFPLDDPRMRWLAGQVATAPPRE